MNWNRPARETIGYSALAFMLAFGIGYIATQRIRQPVGIVFDSHSDPVHNQVAPPKSNDAAPVAAPAPQTAPLTDSPADSRAEQRADSPTDSRATKPFDDASKPPNASKTKEPPSAPISINQADATELMKLPGIGAALAGRIVDYRSQHGGFQSIDELRAVRGIGQKKYEKIAPYVKL